MKLGKVEKQSFWYSFFREYVKFVHDKIFYKKVIYLGTENIPKDKPVLYAPNHQNALMDAFAVQFAQNEQIVFLARSDIFKGKFLSSFMFFAKILPVYRLRDGKEKLKLNDLIFKKTVEVIEKKRVLTIFPEAQHIDKRHLRKPQKGIQRAAFLAEERNNFNLDVHVIPVGVYYSNYWNFRSVLQVRFGEAIPISDYKEAYKTHHAKSMVAFGERMKMSIKELMIDIQDLNYYDTYETIRSICDEEMLEKLNLKFSYENKFIADQQTIKKVEGIQKNDFEKFEKIDKLIQEYSKLIKHFNLKDWVLRKQVSKPKTLMKFFLLLMFFPIFLYGYLNHIIGYFLTKPITSKLKDKQFLSSVTFGIGMVSFPVLYIIQTFIFYNFTENYIFSGLYLLTLPLFGLFAFNYSRCFVKTKAQCRFIKNKTSEKMQKLLKIRKQIINFVTE